MVSSVIRRQIRRYFGSVEKDARGFRWRFPIPWGDGAEPVKAEQGAERSLCGRHRRKRGLRRGKARSREGKSRRSPPQRPSDPNCPSARSIMRACVQLDFYYEKEEAFVKRLRRFKKVEDWSDEREDDRPGVFRPNRRYLAARAGWESLRGRMRRGSKALAPRCCSFRHLLESRVGVFAEGVDRSLRYWLEDYEFLRDARRELEIDPLSEGWLSTASSTLRRIEQPGKQNKARRNESKSSSKRSTSSLTRGKPNGKRERPREFIQCEPFLVTRAGNPYCSHCGGPAFAWNQHRCAQAWRRQQGSTR